jgi:putative Mn2+ efflux pump MntP
MSFGGVLALALALAMDATAVAGARGLAAPVVRARDAVLVGLLFGGAQALMPALGWLLGARLGPVIAAWDHWVAFVLLVGIGGKMLWEAAHADGAGERGGFRLGDLLVLALATSVDAFAAGITLPMLGAPLLLSLVTIGVTTAVLSAAAVPLGRRFAARWGRRLDALGGVALILLGVKILVQHLRA